MTTKIVAHRSTTERSQRKEGKSEKHLRDIAGILSVSGNDNNKNSLATHLHQRIENLGYDFRALWIDIANYANYIQIKVSSITNRIPPFAEHR